MTSEFDLIRRYFTRATPGALLGVGDDAALLQAAPGMVLAAAADMLVAGRHFSPDDGPGTIGFKSLAVNLSDLAAMGATPRWAMLALALPEADASWLRGFAGGFFGLAQKFGVELVGGDTTRGPLTVCVQVMGEVPAGQAIRRSGAQPGDEIWVSGALGDAALALAHLQRRLTLDFHEAAACLPFLHVPMPRVALGQKLRGVASSAIDISDGFLGDLGHLLTQSQVAAEIAFAALPVSDVVRRYLAQPVARECVLSGGDDYELLFTAPAARHAEIAALEEELALRLTVVGRIQTGEGWVLRAPDGTPMSVTSTGYDHFRAETPLRG